jgi:hypothetical protein
MNTTTTSTTTSTMTDTMTSTTTDTTDPTGATTDPAGTDLAVARTKRIGVVALATATVAALAGLCMLVFDPAAGSTIEAILGFTAAVSGLLTAALLVGAVIHAHVTGLWGRLPINWRYVVWVLLAIGVARTIWSQVSNLS